MTRSTQVTGLTRRSALGLLGCAALATAVVGSHAALLAADGPYRLLKEIPIGTEGGWDYAAVDSAAKRLYVSHATSVVVIDTATNDVVGTIAPTPGVHGIAIAPDLGKGFISNGRENKAAVFDPKTLKILSSVDTGANPDAILYEPGHKEVYTFNGTGKSATVFDAATGAVKATIPLPGKPEFAVVDVKAGRIYNNIEDADAIVAIDTAKHAVVNTWPIAPGEGASGLAIDLANHRLFAVCDKVMVMIDSQTGKVTGTLPIGDGPDATAYDPGTGYVFASASDGTMTVAKVDAGKLVQVQKLTTPPRTRTMTIDTATHRVYAAAGEFKAGPAGADGRPGRPTMVPGSFKVMVYELVK
jgi:DNA-binding beta-propeller fold protein YncE